MKVIHGLPMEQYRAAAGISSSLLKQLLKNPYEAAAGIQKEPTPAMELGSAVHCAILEAADYQKRYGGKGILTERQRAVVKGISESVNKSMVGKLVKSGRSEVSIFAPIEIEGKTYQAKARFDFLTNNGAIIDLKTTTDASADGFTRAIANLNYFMQAAWYLDTAAAAGVEARQFVFLAIETAEPFMCGVYELSPEWIDLGRSEYKRALAIYDRLSEYSLPIYKDDNGEILRTLTPPAWLFYRRGANY